MIIVLISMLSTPQHWNVSSFYMVRRVNFTKKAQLNHGSAMVQQLFSPVDADFSKTSKYIIY